MVTSNQLTPGMTISLTGKLFRVESSVKVTVPKGTPFIKTKLRNLVNGEIVEKNLKVDQDIKDVSLAERPLEFLYMEGPDYLFLDVKTLDQVLVPADVVGKKLNFLKEGIEVMAALYGDTVFSIELPQFLELMVAKTKDSNDEAVSRIAILETGAEVEVPPFIDVGDIVKVDTNSYDYIQRV